MISLKRKRRGAGRATAAVVAVLALLVTACSSGDDGTKDAGKDGTSTPVKIALGFEPAQLNPAFGTATDGIVGAAFLEHFVAVDENLTVNDSGLATSWERTGDRSWTFKVRPNVKFQNGEPLDAKAVAFSIETMKAEPGVFNSFYQVIDKVTVVDPLTLEVATSAPSNAIPETFASLWLVPPAYYAEVGKDGFGAEPIGTGPFKFTKWNRGTEITAEANPDYWQGAPRAPGLSWTFAPEASTRTSLLETGAVHIVQDIPVGQQKSVEEAGFEITRFSPTGLMRLQISKESSPLNDRELRVAAAQAIDREAIVDGIFGGDGIGAKATDVFFSDVFDLGPAPTSDDTTYNPEAAKATLAKRGGVDLNLYYTTGRWPADHEVGEAVAGMLDAVGFKVKRIPMDPTEFITAKNTSTWSGAMLHVTRAVFPHPSVFVGAYLLKTSSSQYCVNPEYDRLNEVGVSSNDPEEAKEAYRSIEKLTLIDDLCFVNLYEQIIAYGVDSHIRDFKPTRDELIDYRTLRYEG